MNSNTNNVIIVINIHNNICENVLSSHIHAANRWGCKYLLEHESYISMKSCYPSWNKLGILLDSQYNTYDNILILDSDILININAPNPFHIADQNKFNVVRDSHYEFIDNDVKLYDYIKDFITPHYEYLKKHDTRVNFSYIKNYFNSGMMIYSPKMTNINENKYINIINESIQNGSSHREQGLINYIIQQEMPINFLETTWNITNPDLSNSTMGGHMYHFTGDNWHYLKEAVKTYDWKTSNNIV